jgi:hypothetical protein
MSFFDSIVVSIFCIALVFFVLISLFVLIALFSKVFAAAAAKQGKTSVQVAQTAMQPAAVPQNMEGPDLSTGKLKLKGVDEKTAAMIMAIVSHESSIPLSELRFKSIRALEEK